MANTILVVDDESDMVELVADALARGGYRVIKATSGEEALKALSEDVPSLIIADLNMPGLSGFQLSQKVRSDPRFAATHMLLLSGLVQEDHEAQGLQQGDYYMAKPFSGEKLLEKVRMILGE